MEGATTSTLARLAAEAQSWIEDCNLERAAAALLELAHGSRKAGVSSQRLELVLPPTTESYQIIRGFIESRATAIGLFGGLLLDPSEEAALRAAQELRALWEQGAGSELAVEGLFRDLAEALTDLTPAGTAKLAKIRLIEAERRKLAATVPRHLQVYYGIPVPGEETESRSVPPEQEVRPARASKVLAESTVGEPRECPLTVKEKEFLGLLAELPPSRGYTGAQAAAVLKRRGTQTSDDQIRRTVKALREQGWDIPNQQRAGSGYRLSTADRERWELQSNE